MSRRWVSTVLASATTLALLAGCGGRGAEQVAAAPAGAAADATRGTATSSDVAAAPAVPPAAERTDSAAKAAKSTGVTDNAVAQAGGTAAAHGSATSAVTSPQRGRTSVSAGTAGTTQSAVERLVATSRVFGGTAPCMPATLSDVPFGNVSTLSGILGELMLPARSALQTFVAAQNACGGLNGHRFRISFEDDQGDPATAAAKAQELIQRQKILAFVGNVEVLTIDAVVPVVNRYKIPIIGGDLASSTWFTNPLLFPQGPPGAAVAYGYLKGATGYFKKNVMGDIYCVEVPRGCGQNDAALKELAPDFGVTLKKSLPASITAPSYVQQCLELKSAGVEALALLMDAASMVRMARSCEQVQYYPNVLPTSLGVGAEKQFLAGNKWLGNAYVALNFFPWFATQTPAEKYWRTSLQKYSPGIDLGTTASAGWTAGALLLAAAAELSPTNPTTADLLTGLYTFQGQKWTGLGGLAGPRTFATGRNPRVPYCYFAAISNADNTGWASSIATPQCTDVLAASDPQRNGDATR
ncbi:MAG TPA: ABC transporter substrate-binding protein [Sporichthyaceae bacterium]|jgi:branched-chain amino acid transport system substrate-binding protein